MRTVFLQALAALVAVASLGACSFRAPIPAPVEDRGSGRASARPVPSVPTPAQASGPGAVAPAAAPARQTPAADPARATRVPDGAGPCVGPQPCPARPLRGLENAGKPGFYTVQKGDTLVRIALDHGQNWRDLVRWNQMENPNLIEVGEVLRVVPPSDGVTGQALAPGVRPPASAPSAAPTGGSAAAAPSASAPSPSASGSATADELAWIWPAQGTTVGTFDEAKNKGIDIAGKAGDPVLAAADGRVVYAGSGLRGYGNLIIIKHNNTYLTAYAHNRSLLVKEDQAVRQGQRIAEMGSTDSDQVKLHFEIRRQGKPVDPVRYLPPK